MIQTERLYLREIEIEDAADIFEYASLKRVCDLTQEKLHITIEDTLCSIYQFHFLYEERNTFPTYVLELKTTGKVTGLVSLHTKLGKGVYEIGFECNPNYQNKGYMYEALNAYLSTLNQYAIEEIIAETFHYNVSSRKLLEKLNFEVNKITDQYIYYKRRIQ